MAWSKIDDKFWWHRKIRSAGNAAVGAFVRMLSYSADHLADGFVDQDTVELIASRREVEALLGAGLVERVEGGLLLHDYLAYNPSREQALAERAAAAERQRRRRHGVTDAEVSRRDSRVDSRRESHDPVPSRPVLTTSSSYDGGPQVGDNPVVADLVEQLRVESMPVRADRMTVEQAAAVVRLVDVHGIPRLVAVARRVWRPDRPAVHLQALIGDWEAMRPPGVASIARSVCERHGTEFRTVCAGCAADRKAAGA